MSSRSNTVNVVADFDTACSNSKNSNDFGFLDEYQRIAGQTDQSERIGTNGLAFSLLGLFGEVGSLLTALKKKQREPITYFGYSQAILEELGDSLWYVGNLASRLSTSLSSIAELSRYQIANQSAVLQKTESECESNSESPEFEAALIGLAGKVGTLLETFHEGNLRLDENSFREHLSEVFSALCAAADVAGISLHEAARQNLSKITSRWPIDREYPALFDIHFPPNEQLPRKIEMQILEFREGRKRWVVQLCNGEEIGSPLTDNKLAEDDYRFHDVFHLSYAAILGWSPCLRALLKVKRKSRSDIDENEDGARAVLTEEGVSAMVFQHALHLNFFAGIKSLDYSLLKSIRQFVSGYEVERCPLWQWEKAILEGFDVFRKLRAARRGVVVADLTKRSIVFKSASE